MTVQYLHRVKYPCDYETDNYNPICPGIKGVTSDVLMRAFLLLQQNQSSSIIAMIESQE